MASEAVSNLYGVGPALSKKLEKLNIRTKLDLILHLPFRYEDRTVVSRIADVVPGSEFYVQGQIIDLEFGRSGQQSTYITIRDDSERKLRMRLIHHVPRQLAALRNGFWLRLYGSARFSTRGLEMVHPDYRVFESYPGPPDPEYVPIYRTTYGLSSARIRSLVKKALDETVYLPDVDFNGRSLSESIRYLHEPDAKRGLEGVEEARKRIAFDELLAFNLLQQRRQIQHKTYNTHALSRQSDLHTKFVESLGFTLTGAQSKVVNEVFHDLSSDKPMLRLLQGDVGSGKTVVAALAAIRAAENDVQTAFMAPTELLAEQHHETLSLWMEPLGIQVGLLTGRMTAPARKARKNAIASGQDMVVVGTHALFQEATQFQFLGLTIIDEQHRFGVHQRMQLRDKGRLPHQLVMTATPIPRTLAMYLFAHMDVSVIDELPPGRQTIQTTVHNPKQREAVIGAVDRLLQADQQAYWVCVAIEESDAGDFVGTETVLQELQRKLPHVRIGHLHGRMKPDLKAQQMHAFRTGKTQLLVATTVIEVGIDIPNATLMVIDNAERLGLAQLHQLRGRVGRGAIESHCMLNYEQPISDMARRRLNALKSTNNGFDLAELDMSLRGPGEFFGTKQSGTENFRVANLETDVGLLQDVGRVGSELIQSDPDLASDIINTWSPKESDYAAV